MCIVQEDFCTSLLLLYDNVINNWVIYVASPWCTIQNHFIFSYMHFSASKMVSSGWFLLLDINSMLLPIKLGIVFSLMKVGGS